MSDPTYVAVLGSRDYPNPPAVLRFVKSLSDDVALVSGGAIGVDLVAERAARDRGLWVFIKPANWNLHGKSAGFVRNREMLEFVHAHHGAVVVFWDGFSRGTLHSIKLAKKLGVQLFIADEDGFVENFPFKR